jgi:hypothetical protein
MMKDIVALDGLKRVRILCQESRDKERAEDDDRVEREVGLICCGN